MVLRQEISMVGERVQQSWGSVSLQAPGKGAGTLSATKEAVV